MLYAYDDEAHEIIIWHRYRTYPERGTVYDAYGRKVRPIRIRKRPGDDPKG